MDRGIVARFGLREPRAYLSPIIHTAYQHLRREEAWTAAKFSQDVLLSEVSRHATHTSR